jgi:hypothetical protein
VEGVEGAVLLPRVGGRHQHQPLPGHQQPAHANKRPKKVNHSNKLPLTRATKNLRNIWRLTLNVVKRR